MFKRNVMLFFAFILISIVVQQSCHNSLKTTSSKYPIPIDSNQVSDDYQRAQDRLKTEYHDVINEKSLVAYHSLAWICISGRITDNRIDIFNNQDYIKKALTSHDLNHIRCLLILACKNENLRKTIQQVNNENKNGYQFHYWPLRISLKLICDDDSTETENIKITIIQMLEGNRYKVSFIEDIPLLAYLANQPDTHAGLMQSLRYENFLSARFDPGEMSIMNIYLFGEKDYYESKSVFKSRP